MLTEQIGMDMIEASPEYQEAYETYVQILSGLLTWKNHRITRSDFDKAVDLYFKAEDFDTTQVNASGIHRRAFLQATEQVIDHPELKKEFRKAIVDKKLLSVKDAQEQRQKYSELVALVLLTGND